MKMDVDLQKEITRRLVADFQFKETSKWLQKGLCPGCNKRTLYTHGDTPWRVACGRENNCKWVRTVKELYEDLFESWSDRFKASETNPHAAADAYLETGRALAIGKLRGAYTQEYYVDRDSGESTATVRFPIGTVSWWERFIDRPGRFARMKARFQPGASYAGYAWLPPTSLIDVATADEIWITEGIFNAIALCQVGIPAISAMSSVNYPGKTLDTLVRGDKRPRLIWALDADKSGRENTIGWVRKARKAGWSCGAAQVPQEGDSKIDWNDLFMRGELAEDRLADTVKLCRYRGELLIARSAGDKARLIHEHTEMATFPLEFGNRVWWYEFDASLYQRALKEGDPEVSEEERKDQAAKTAGKLNEIANCVAEPLYFQRNMLTSETWYYLRIKTAKGGVVKDIFRGDQLASASEYKKRLMSVLQGANFFGTTQQLDRYWNDDLLTLRAVEAVDFVGYSREHSAYLLGDIAVKAGRVIPINEEDFFDLGNRMHVKSPSKSVKLVISTDPRSFRTDWVDMLWRVFGARGMVALTFWFASLFAEQIRSHQESFPFLELIGKPGSGKTTLVKFLWRLIGRAGYEGVDPSKSTLAARARNFVQVANLPVVLTEGDRKDDTAKAKKFDFNELKTAYNGGSIRALGVKSAGNETIEPPFRGSIVIEQNDEVEADRAVLERIVHLYFDKSNHRPELKLVAEELHRIPMADVSYFIVAATKAEPRVMETILKQVPLYEVELAKSLADMRLIKNHAQLLAAFDAMCGVLPVPNDRADAVRAFIQKMAADRQNALATDHPDVQRFWEIYDLINPGQLSPVLNHSKNKNFIAVSLTHFEQEAAQRFIKPPTAEALKRVLNTSTARKFVTVKNVKSNIWKDRSVWCYVFERDSPASSDDLDG